MESGSEMLAPGIPDVTESSPREVLRKTVAGELASIHVGCPSCGQSFIIPVARDDNDDAKAGTSARTTVHCADCDVDLPVDRLDPAQPVTHCAVCSNEEFYGQKDFNRVLGLWVVVLSGLIALLAMLLLDHRVGIAILFSVTLLDWIIYRFLRDVSVCYLCHTIYRAFPRNPESKAFYLGSEEKYKRLKQKWIESLRK